MPEYRQNNSIESRAKLMQTLLHHIAETAEFSARNALPPHEVKQCLRDALVKLEEAFPEHKPGLSSKEEHTEKLAAHLDAEEISALLKGFEAQA